ncbi:MAG: TIGR03087 family PEP-CTERM/XrtA system glycosyltransferase [Pseudomonadota bacterium]
MGDILFLAHRIPFPPDRGDKIRAFNVLKYLSSRKRVHLIAFADDSRDLKHKNALAKLTGNRSIFWRSKSNWVAALQSLMSRKPASLTAFQHAGVQEAVDNLLARHAIDTIYVFSSQMAQYLPDSRRQRVVMDFCDVDSAKFAQYGKSTGGPRGWMMRREGKLLLAHDRSVAARVDASLFISPAEAAVFERLTGAERIHVIENGIDTALFDPAAPFKRIETTGQLIVFTGQMDYRPNIEAVTWFVDTILPHIRVRHPSVRFAVVGRNPTPEIQKLTEAPGVIVTGEVADVRGWLAAAAVVVAPLKLARGVQNKVLEAMAMARPVVASAAAAEGIDHAGTIRVGSDVTDLSEAVIALLDAPGEGAKLGAAARARVIERYGWDACLAPLDSIMGLPVRVSAPAQSAA